ncbi:MAG TPA: carotenoid oxygenase family protein [Aquabacterium sp.]|uniref:carotenoid oxygenase family protein n=1 Tax=Aquabacterium sp. TaxID=1872578 RepID=UPI002E306710|nr:carotenoid oxygenase family protein [Aquabacterium sp.]HEX5374402.1 carotenoid oxygenase family protein [Aquabacterium sp.]
MSKSLHVDAAPPLAKASAETVTNPFLQGPFAPVAQERTDTSLTVHGQLPPELHGIYARIGPNPIKPPAKPQKYHWFTGDGMVHGVRLEGGQARWYRNRWIGSKSVQKNLQRPKLPGDTRGVFDTVNTNVFAHAGRIWASVEAGPMPVQLDAELNSVKHGLPGFTLSLPFSAHPHLDPISGDLHAVCYDAIQHRQVFYVRVGTDGEIDKVVRIHVQHGPMIHDCAITRSKVMVLDLPVTFSWWELVKRSGFPYIWNDRHPARVGVLPREGDSEDIRWYEVDPCFVFHTCNAYDLPDGGVVMDVVVHERMFDRSRVGPEADTQARFERWTLPAQGHRVERQVICTRAQEFPRLDERRVGQSYRYAYAVEFSADALGGQSLLKHDLQQGGTTEHRFGADRKPGEFVFVPKSAEAAEDEGWLMGLVYNLRTQHGELHVLDAQDLTREAQAIVEMPDRIPMGFHGNWIADAALTPRA